jgi:hypothetical protein
LKTHRLQAGETEKPEVLKAIAEPIKTIFLTMRDYFAVAKW